MKGRCSEYSTTLDSGISDLLLYSEGSLPSYTTHNQPQKISCHFKWWQFLTGGSKKESTTETTDFDYLLIRELFYTLTFPLYFGFIRRQVVSSWVKVVGHGSTDSTTNFGRSPFLYSNLDTFWIPALVSVGWALYSTYRCLHTTRRDLYNFCTVQPYKHTFLMLETNHLETFPVSRKKK